MAPAFRSLALVAALVVALVGCASAGPGSRTVEPATPGVADRHEGEAVFTGVVTGYGSADGRVPFCVEEEDCIAVDGAAVSLALITTWEISCHDRSGLDRELAVRAKEEALPIGTRVQVVRDRETDDAAFEMSGFVHRLDDSGAPLASSLNEELVAGGYWVPGYVWSNSQRVGNFRPSTNWVSGADTSTGETLYALNDAPLLTPVQAEYAQALLDAANGARIDRVGGQDACRSQIERMAADDAAGADHYREVTVRLEAEYERWRREHPGWDHCIDGDGDGICHER